MDPFKDHFSKQARVYAAFRPIYPTALFDYLSKLTPAHQLAWDGGTGNGQAAIQLAAWYEKVYATDPSEEQIHHAIRHERITYQVETAEQSTLADHSVDIMTVAQAVHWFHFDRFYAEVKRVLKPQGILAVWAYGIPVVTDASDAIIKHFHDHTAGEFWLPENKLIDQEYATLPFPFEAISAPTFFIRKQLTLAALLGHFSSWSATQKYIDTYQKDPIEPLAQRLLAPWGDPAEAKEVRWKLIVKVGRHSGS